MKRVKHVSSDEDGETYYVIGDVTKLGAIRAFWKFVRECGIEEDMRDGLSDDNTSVSEIMEKRNFWYTEGGEADGYYWWEKPTENEIERCGITKVEPVGIGWVIEVF